MKFLNRRGHYTHASSPFHRQAKEAFTLKGAPSKPSIFDAELWGYSEKQGRRPLDFYELLSIEKGNMIEATRFGAVPQIMVFDCLQFDGQDVRGLPYMQRTAIYLGEISKNAIVAPALRKLVRTSTEVEDAFNFMLKFGFEGTMLKMPYSPYDSGTRSRSWLKLKPILEADVFVIGVKPMVEDPNRVGSVRIAVYDENRQVVEIGGCNVPLDRDRKPEDLFDKVLTVYYQSVISTNGERALRFPAFAKWRPDKVKTECRDEQLTSPRKREFKRKEEVEDGGTINRV